LILSAFASLAVVSVFQHEQSARSLRLLHEGYLPLALTVGEARSTQALFAALLERVLQDEQSATARGWLQVARRSRPTTLRRALHGLSRVERLAEYAGVSARVTRVRSELDSVQRLMTETETQYEGLVESLRDGDQEEAQRIVARLHRSEHAIRIHFRQAWRELQAAISDISEDAAVQERETALVLGILTFLALIVGLAVIIWAQRLLKPLSLLQARVTAVTRGDERSTRLESQRDDELGRLTNAFEEMVEALETRGASLRRAAQAQRHLQRLQEQIVAGLSSAIVVVDAEGLVGTINPAAADLITIQDEHIGMPFKDTDFYASIEVLPSAMASVRDGLERVSIDEVRVSLDRERVLNIWVQPIDPDHAGERAPLLIVAEDVTQELVTQDRLIQTERLAAIGRMAAHVTHEVRNPLSSIGLNVDLLEEEFNASDRQSLALVRAIQRELDRLKALTDEYLRLARLPSPLLEPDNLGELLESVLAFVRPEIEGADVELKVDIAPDLPLVAFDESQVRQVILNLLRNAREAMPDGGRLQVGIEAEGEGVLLAISDNGIGVPAQERERIFDLFHTTKDSGTGLGLALTRQIVTAHGGKIQCCDAAGQGTRFELWFPAVRSSPDV